MFFIEIDILKFSVLFINMLDVINTIDDINILDAKKTLFCILIMQLRGGIFIFFQI